MKHHFSGQNPSQTHKKDSCHAAWARHLLGGGYWFWSVRIVLCLLLLGAGWAFVTPRPPLLEGVSFSTVVLDRHQNLMRLSLADDERYRVRTSLHEISPEFIEMTLLYEDRYFFYHPGVNPFAVFRAAWATFIGGDRSLGASTITMQVARLRLNLNTKSIGGKLRQMERALAYELSYSKTEILEAYFNLAPYGGNIEGCGAAAHIYYHKKPYHLSLAETASLVSVPQNPTRRNPLALRRLSVLGERDTALEEAQTRLVDLWVERHPEDKTASFLGPMRLEAHGPESLPFIAPHVSTEAIALFDGGVPVQTTIDFRLQRQLERHVAQMVERQAEKGIQNASALLVHWPTRQIRALVGSADFHDVGIEGQVDGTRAKRSPGSTLKPFIYALALEQGVIHPKTVLYDTPKSFGSYDPENADQIFKGPLSAEEALRQSRNIPAISLANQLTEPDLYDFLQAADVNLPFAKEHYGLALVLGGGDVTMRELAGLYATLPNKGAYAPLVLFKESDKRILRKTPHEQKNKEETVLPAQAKADTTKAEMSMADVASLEIPAHGIDSAVTDERSLGSAGDSERQSIRARSLALTDSHAQGGGDNQKRHQGGEGFIQGGLKNFLGQQEAPERTGINDAAMDSEQGGNYSGKNKRQPKQLLSGESALITLSMLRTAPFTQPGHVSAMVRRAPMYWKTGTSNGYHDAWTAGIFGPYVLIVWVGNFDNVPNSNFVGIKAAAPLFWEIADSLHSMERFGDEPMRDFGRLNIKRVPVCRGTGDIKTNLCPDTIESYFIPGVSPIADSGVYREILIDTATGKRACVNIPGQTKKVVWEFWPTQLQRVFKQAGIIKPSPPPFLPECAPDDNPWGTAPEILSPKEGVTYHRSLHRAQQTVVVLQASGEADVTEFFWFGGDTLIGRSQPGAELVWSPPAGITTVRVVDNFGRSASRVIEVELTE